MAQAASQTSDGRMQALAAATTALNLYSNKKEISDAASALASGDPSSAASISISLGSSKSQNNSSSASDSARGSSITAGGDVTISALGAGQDSNITVQGSTINAGNNAKLLADNEIKLLAAKNDYTQTSSNSSSSGSIGISLGASTGVTLSASKARGNSDGTDTSYTNTFIQAGNTASLSSGGDTSSKNLIGGTTIKTLAEAADTVTARSAAQAQKLQQELSGFSKVQPDTVLDAFYLANTDQRLLNANKFDMNHVLSGEINGAGKATGYHAELAAEGSARIRPGSAVTQNANGTYSAPVQIWDSSAGQWIDKVNRQGSLQPSTFFNPSWSQARIEYEVAQAFKAGRIDTPIGRSFIGTTPSGIKIQFHSDSVRTTFYPTGP